MQNSVDSINKVDNTKNNSNPPISSTQYWKTRYILFLSIGLAFILGILLSPFLTQVRRGRFSFEYDIDKIIINEHRKD